MCVLPSLFHSSLFPFFYEILQFPVNSLSYLFFFTYFFYYIFVFAYNFVSLHFLSFSSRYICIFRSRVSSIIFLLSYLFIIFFTVFLFFRLCLIPSCFLLLMLFTPSGHEFLLYTFFLFCYILLYFCFPLVVSLHLISLSQRYLHFRVTSFFYNCWFSYVFFL